MTVHVLYRQPSKQLFNVIILPIWYLSLVSNLAAITFPYDKNVILNITRNLYDKK